MKKITAIILVIISSISIFVGCNNEIDEINSFSEVENLDFEFDVDPETFKLNVKANEISETASEGMTKREVSNLNDKGNSISWEYDKEDISVSITKEKEYLDVSIKSDKKSGENEFSWPSITGEGYTLPLGEGKYIPSDGELWKEYLKENEIKGIEGLSMQFFAVDKSEYSLVYIIKNPHNNQITFDTENDIELNFKHEYPSINENKEYGFRIYLTKKNPVDIAKTYRNYMIEKDEFKTLNQKAKENKNIEKLYGAPHAYFWDRTVISEENIKWNLLKANLSDEMIAWMKELLLSVEDGEELSKAFDDLKNQDYVDKYTKNRIINIFSTVMQLDNFYNKNVFKNITPEIKSILDKGIDKLNQVEIIDLNKKLMKSELKDDVDPIELWANANTVDVINDMKNSGLDNMWVGFDDWRNGFVNPKLVDLANEVGYLVGSYDSYHSIHKSGEEKWITATFNDKSLFDNATVTDKNGEKIEGFQGVGRKLNPTLAMPSVKERLDSILGTGIKFNSWFLDTDATGEVFDDYSENHITTEEEDIKARLDRIKYIQNELGLVVGSEGGNNFASKEIAFAHGIETPAFSWMDEDMSKNKESEYYVGRYYSSTGGVPEMFAKPIPLKDKYKKLFLDETYNIPLYKLVYNDSVITTHWWGWGTLKFKDETQNRMLNEVLYNVPPLYHLDKEEWNKNKDVITKHSKIWSEFSKKAIKKEMTDYKILSDDKSLQMTKYGDDLSVIANFSDDEAEFEGNKISGKSLIIIDKNKITEYTPSS